MKILYLTPNLPYPPHTGGQLRSWFLLRDLAKRGSVTLVSIGRPDQYAPYMLELKKYCRQILLADPKKFEPNEHLNCFRSTKQRFMKLVRWQPWLLDDFVNPEILKQVELAEPESYDLIVCRFAVMAYYFLTEKKFQPLLRRTVIDIDDMSTMVQERKIKSMKPGYKKLRNLLDLFLLKAYYRKLHKTQACFVVSQKDRDYAAENRISANAFVIPNVFEVNGRPLTAPEKVEAPEILFCGMMSYPPNQEAIIHFCENIFPMIKKEIPNAHLTIVGKNMPEKITKLGAFPGVTIAGYVPSMEPYYEKTAIVVVPLLNGGGTRIKILEAMAYGRPVVSTSVGAEGLEVSAGEHILIADEPREFADRCVELLQDPRKRASIASRAYQLVKEKYDTGVFRQKMDEVFQTLTVNERGISK